MLPTLLLTITYSFQQGKQNNTKKLYVIQRLCCCLHLQCQDILCKKLIIDDLFLTNNLLCLGNF